MISDYFISRVSDRIKIEKFCNDKNASFSGAFSKSAVVTFKITVPHILGINNVKIKYNADGSESVEKSISVAEHLNSVDVYTFTMTLANLCKKDSIGGLVYYNFMFLDDSGCFYTDTCNNYDFALKRDTVGSEFRILIYEDTLTVPGWFSGGIMYHVFVDRFRRGDGYAPVSKRAVLDENWDDSNVQYACCRGGNVENNLFFGGNLWGVCEKLSYLSTLGVDIIYLSPIFKAYSNHKYDTGDYLEIDEMFGGREAFELLLKKSLEYGIKIILDGVFNHTGTDSRYFNKYGNYDSVGAYQSEDSEYKNWYKFVHYPNEYASWWGIETLPTLNHNDPKCRGFFCGSGGVGEKYINDGIAGFRLDVADELSDEFLDEFSACVKKASSGKAIIIGEVWENAADKTAYGKRRRYFRGGQLDSVMNYPFRNGIIAFLRYADAQTLYNILTEIYTSYPRVICNALMNILDTHDTERILTALGTDDFDNVRDSSNEDLCKLKMSKKEYSNGKKLLKIAALLQYTVYGVPSVFYGSEAGIEGFCDPFCRHTFPWGNEDRELLEYYRLLGKIRKSESVFKDGEFKILECGKHHIVYSRENEKQCIVVVANMAQNVVSVPLGGMYKDLLIGEFYRDTIDVESKTAVVLKHITEDPNV